MNIIIRRCGEFFYTLCDECNRRVVLDGGDTKDAEAVLEGYGWTERGGAVVCPACSDIRDLRLKSAAALVNAPSVALGFNREDVLDELMQMSERLSDIQYFDGDMRRNKMDDFRGLYRGKTTPKRNGEAFNNIWVEGDLIHSVDLCYIHPITNSVKVQNELGRFIVMHEVDPSTLGECTGLRDKNGKLIFEGDILSEKPPMNNIAYVGYVKYDEELTAFRIVFDNSNVLHILGSYSTSYTVIGNVHDNPELLKQGEHNENI